MSPEHFKYLRWITCASEIFIIIICVLLWLSKRARQATLIRFFSFVVTGLLMIWVIILFLGMNPISEIYSVLGKTCIILLMILWIGFIVLLIMSAINKILKNSLELFGLTGSILSIAGVVTIFILSNKIKDDDVISALEMQRWEIEEDSKSDSSTSPTVQSQAQPSISQKTTKIKETTKVSEEPPKIRPKIVPKILHLNIIIDHIFRDNYPYPIKLSLPSNTPKSKYWTEITQTVYKKCTKEQQSIIDQKKPTYTWRISMWSFVRKEKQTLIPLGMGGNPDHLLSLLEFDDNGVIWIYLSEVPDIDTDFPDEGKYKIILQPDILRSDSFRLAFNNLDGDTMISDNLMNWKETYLDNFQDKDYVKKMKALNDTDSRFRLEKWKTVNKGTRGKEIILQTTDEYRVDQLWSVGNRRIILQLSIYEGDFW